MAKPVQLVLAGAMGRLGQEICHAIPAQTDVSLAGVLVRAAKPGAAQQIGTPVYTNIKDMPAGFDVLLDVSTPTAAIAHLDVAIAQNKATVIGVTGFSDAQKEHIARAAKHIPVLLSGNFSIGVHQILAQVRSAAQRLGPTWSARILETHHTDKKDHPSGTALMLARAIFDGWGHEVPIVAALYPKTPVPNPDAHLPITSTRKAGVVGQHSVIFSNTCEEIVLSHSAHSRAIFAGGALAAVKWIDGQPPGLYAMCDVLGV